MPSRLCSSLGHLAGDRDVPAADEQRRDGGDGRVEPRLDAPLDAAQVRLGRREVLLAREEQRDVDRHAGEDRLLDRGQALRGAGDLDEEVGPCRRARWRSSAAASVLAVSWASSGETSSDTQPSTPSVPGVDGPEQVGRAGQILKRQLEEQLLARFALPALLGGCARRRSVLSLMAWSKIVGFEVSPVTESSSM